MHTERNNQPLWLIFALITLAIIVTLIAYLIQQDSQTDEIRPNSDSIIEVGSVV